MLDSTCPESSASAVLNISSPPCEVDFSVLDSSGRATPEQREQILCAFDASGLSARSFAKRHGLKYTTFTNWVSRRGAKRISKCAAGMKVSLVEAVLASPESSSAGITIECFGGFRIQLKNRCDVGLVVELLRALKG